MSKKDAVLLAALVWLLWPPSGSTSVTFEPSNPDEWPEGGVACSDGSVWGQDANGAWMCILPPGAGGPAPPNV